MRGLIGYTGLVGSNLVKQMKFDRVYNSSNIKEICGERFQDLICAGVPSVKWWANKHPEEDWKNICSLLEVLRNVAVGRFILISTVDVYDTPIGVDEDSRTDRKKLQPYGLNRLKVEEFIEENYDCCTIIRLPGVFGKGLKKNIIYDFITENETWKIHSESQYQFYSLERIGKDVLKAVSNDLSKVNFGTEPVKVEEIVDYAFGRKFQSEPDQPPAMYDMRTRHAQIYGSENWYIQRKGAVLEEIRQFVKKTKREW
jgi:nucleoside-diphosphate-sugar epimerase